MTTKIYHNPRCSKSRQTLNLLQEQGVEMEVVEYLKTPPTEAELKQVVQQLGIKPRALLRKTEAEYKELGLAKAELSDDEIIQVMCTHPKLIERPIVINNGQAKIGRPPEAVLEII